MAKVTFQSSLSLCLTFLGGGLVILLSGAPGVGKTLTAESVAEKMKRESRGLQGFSPVQPSRRTVQMLLRRIRIA